ncbi:methyltransferase domain-containing protein [Candidatus Micrarchaeota archaeon]|nr:methyltransferase domain-containing protein [Candidatus Micrarchaeota archaeon]
MNLAPSEFEMEYTTVWSFPDRGTWATHKGNYRGNFSPYIPRNLILRYSKEGELILDQMFGSGTTLVECKLLGRNAIGFDINETAIKTAKERLNFEYETNTKQEIRKGDARELSLEDNSIDLIITHPPYLDIVKYNPENKNDISNIRKLDEFISEIEKIAKESYRVLKKDRYCAILIGDTRRKGMYIPLAYNVMKTFLEVGFNLKEDIIKKQWNCKTTPLWKSQSKKYNFHLIMHEHLFVFKK